MAKYEIKFFDHNSYTARQEGANAWGADLYVEQHLNSGGGDYALAVVGSNASEMSKRFGEVYAHNVAEKT